VARSSSARVLYGGDADGNFIFALRSANAGPGATVIPAQKLPAAVFPPAAFEEFCRRHGIGWIVLEDTGSPQPWSNLLAAPAPSMQLERVLPLESSRARWRGHIRIYRFVSSSAHPTIGLELPVSAIQGAISVGR
jgi:hypothetical protein